MSHEHHGHAHDPAGNADERRVFRAMLLTVGFMLVEVAGGLISGSLALLADAGHMLTDAAALLLAWLGFRISRRPADSDRSYGYHRFEVLAAFVNGLTLFAIVGWIFYEAMQRLFEPVEILPGPMMMVAIAGLAVNLIAFALLHGGDRDNLNIRGAAAHVLGDLLGSVAAIVAAGIILWWGWTPIDPLLSFLICVFILKSAWRIVADSGHILLEGTPSHIDVGKLSDRLRESITEVRGVHHVHVWSLTPKQPLVTLHVTVDASSDQDAVLEKVKSFLASECQVNHSTVQMERTICPDGAKRHDSRDCTYHPH